MGDELSVSEKAHIESAKLYLSFWKWWRWIQGGFGIVLILWAAGLWMDPEAAKPALAFGIFHPLVLLTFGLVAISEAVKSQKVKDRRLLVKLGRKCGVKVY